jgi:putative phosphoesterase
VTVGAGHAVPYRIGVISDTHGSLPDEALAALAGVDAIVHAGDVGGGFVLDLLEQVAPVTLVRGNCDDSGPASRAPLVANVVLGGVRVVVAHRERDLAGSALPSAAGARIAICGHTHVGRVETRDGVLWVNPGSPAWPRAGAKGSVAVVSVWRSGAVEACLSPLS